MKKLYLLIIFICLTKFSDAQLTPARLKDYWQTNGQNITTRFDIDPGYPEIASLLFNPRQNITLAGFTNWIEKELQLRAGVDELRTTYNSSIYSNNLQTLRLQMKIWN